MSIRILCLLLVTVTMGFAQHNKIDSLQELLGREKNNSKRIVLLDQLSQYYFNHNLTEADLSTAEALTLAQKNQDPQLEAQALSNRAHYYYAIGKLSESKKIYLQAIALATQTKAQTVVIQSNIQLADLFLVKGPYDSAYQYYQSAVQLSEKENTDLKVLAQIGMSRFHIRRGELEIALQFAEEAMRLATKTAASTQALAWLQLGRVQEELARLDQAETSLNNASRLGDKGGNLTALINLEQARILHGRGKFEESLRVYSQALSHHRMVGSKYYLAQVNERMGDVLQENGYHELAVKHLEEAIKIAEAHGFKKIEADAYYDMAWAFYRIRGYELSSIYINKAIDQFEALGLDIQKYWCYNLAGNLAAKASQYDSANEYLQQSLLSSQRIAKPYYLSANLFNLGELFLEQKQYQKALPYYWKGLTIDLAIGDTYGQCLYYNRIGRAYTQLGVYDSAEYYLEKAIKLAPPTSGTDIFRVAFIDMANLLHKTGRSDKAVEYYQQYNLFSDSLFSKQKVESQAAYQALYNLEKQEREIELLNKNNALSQAQIRQQRIILYASIAGGLVFLVIGIFYYRFAQRLRNLNSTISEQNEEMLSQAEELTEANNGLTELNDAIQEQKSKIENQAFELKLSYDYIRKINEDLEIRIEARTSELKEAYKELDTFFYRSSHDFRRPLTTFMGLAEVARVLVKDQVALELFSKVDENARNLDRMLQKLQSISDLGAQELVYKEIFLQEIFTLEVEAFRDSIKAKKIQVIIQVKTIHAVFTYPALVKIIVQNLLENAIIFCCDNNARIELLAYHEQDKLVIEVTDNGQGIPLEYQERVFEMYFRANEFAKGNGLGLYIVKKAVQKLQGEVTLQSIMGQGTRVKVTLPTQTHGA